MLSASFVFLLLTAQAGAETLSSPAVLKERCYGKGDHGSCYQLGHFLQSTSIAATKAEGDQHVLAGCRMELGRECSLAEANALRDHTVTGRKVADLVRDHALRENGPPQTEAEADCERGVPEACGKAGVHFLYLAPVTDPGRARVSYTRGCELGHAGSCQALQLMNKGVVKVFDAEI